MLPPRFEVDVQPAILEMVALPITNRIPSNISAKKPLRPVAEAGRGSASGRRIHQSDSTEIKKEAASTKTARAAPTSWISKPASAGPAICATEPVTCSLLLPSIKSLREMSPGRYD